MKLKKDREMPEMMLYPRIEISIQRKLVSIRRLPVFPRAALTTFFADSGASHHMSDQRSYFSSMTPIQKGQ
jgi:hypothetical protein